MAKLENNAQAMKAVPLNNRLKRKNVNIQSFAEQVQFWYEGTKDF